MTVGEKVRRRRAELDLSQPQLARRAGLPETTISRIERDKVRDLRARVVWRLAEALQIPPEELIEGLANPGYLNSPHGLARPSPLGHADAPLAA